jgi:hypothetical protein
MALRDDRAAVASALKTGARARKLHADLDWLGDTTDSMFYYTANNLAKTYDENGRLRLFRYVKAKPMAVDAMQWVTLFPDNPMGGAVKRVGLRQNGAFSVPGLILKHGPYFFTPGADPDVWAARVLDEFQSDAATYRDIYPDASAFLSAIDDITSERPDLSWWHSLLRLYTLVASGEPDAAGLLAHEGVAARQGSFAVGGTTVWELLARHYDDRTGIFAPHYTPQIP